MSNTQFHRRLSTEEKAGSVQFDREKERRRGETNRLKDTHARRLGDFIEDNSSSNVALEEKRRKETVRSTVEEHSVRSHRLASMTLFVICLFAF